jgi:beta-xylosidase
MRKQILFIWLALGLSIGAFAQNRSTIVGSWYDDLRSPNYADATLILEKDGEKYFINRRNGDGSGSRYRVSKNGNAYTKDGDKFGAKYLVTSKGLEIHDKNGYIRTAKPKAR